MRAGCALALALSLAGCVKPTPPKAKPAENQRPVPPPPENATLAKGNAAQAAGDVVAAARIYAAIPAADADHAAAQKALAEVQPDVTAIAQSWLRQVDRQLKQEHFHAAGKRLQYLFNNFTLEEPTRQAVEERLVVADQGLAGARANLEELDRQAEPALAAGDYGAALKTLRRATGLARDIAPESLLDRERVIAALEHRLAATAKTVEAPVTPPPKERPRRRRRGDKEPATPPAAAVSSPAAEEADNEAASEANRTRELLDEAQTFLENRAYFNAIVDFLRVRELDRGNEAARAALAQLEPKRQELVQQYLETANRYFLQQDLASAVPYFRRVVLLEPDNEQAKKGLEMHYNLERIRRERNQK